MTAVWTHVASAKARPAPLCVVRLIDRRTGAQHRVNGMPLSVFTHSPQATITDMMSGRDPALWEARVDLMDQMPRR